VRRASCLRPGDAFAHPARPAILSIFTGPLGPLLALPLVAAESVLLLLLLARPLFLAPALTEVRTARALFSLRAPTHACVSSSDV
jgi:hypothetical protein